MTVHLACRKTVGEFAIAPRMSLHELTEENLPINHADAAAAAQFHLLPLGLQSMTYLVVEHFSHRSMKVSDIDAAIQKKKADFVDAVKAEQAVVDTLQRDIPAAVTHCDELQQAAITAIAAAQEALVRKERMVIQKETCEGHLIALESQELEHSAYWTALRQLYVQKAIEDPEPKPRTDGKIRKNDQAAYESVQSGMELVGGSLGTVRSWKELVNERDGTADAPAPAPAPAAPPAPNAGDGTVSSLPMHARFMLPTVPCLWMIHEPIVAAVMLYSTLCKSRLSPILGKQHFRQYIDCDAVIDNAQKHHRLSSFNAVTGIGIMRTRTGGMRTSSPLPENLEESYLGATDPDTP